MDRGLFSVGCASSVAGMAGWVTTVGTANPSPAFGKSPFSTAQMVGVSHGFRLEFFGQIPPVFPGFSILMYFSRFSGKVDVVAPGRISPATASLKVLHLSSPNTSSFEWVGRRYGTGFGDLVHVMTTLSLICGEPKLAEL